MVGARCVHIGPEECAHHLGWLLQSVSRARERGTLNALAKGEVVAVDIDPRSVVSACDWHPLPQLGTDASHEFPAGKPLLATLAFAEIFRSIEIAAGNFH